MKNGSKLAISVLFDTPTPRRRSPRLSVELRLGRTEQGFLHFLVRLGVAMLHLGEPLRLGVAKLCLSVPISSVLFLSSDKSNNRPLD